MTESWFTVHPRIGIRIIDVPFWRRVGRVLVWGGQWYRSWSWPFVARYDQVEVPVGTDAVRFDYTFRRRWPFINNLHVGILFQPLKWTIGAQVRRSFETMGWNVYVELPMLTAMIGWSWPRS